MAAPLVYLVEDDESIRELVLYALKNSGFEAEGFGEGGPFWKAVEARPPALALLDIMLPGEDGLRLLRRLRADPRTERLPVILLTARSAEYDKVKGLDLGADDYVTKPFGVMELLSRVRAVLRRTSPGEERQPVLRACGIELCVDRRTVTAGGAPVSLTYKEFELLQLLMQNAGIVLTRERVMERVWGYDYAGESRTVDMHIKSLRHKLGGCGAAIRTVRGVGYKLE